MWCWTRKDILQICAKLSKEGGGHILSHNLWNRILVAVFLASVSSWSFWRLNKEVTWFTSYSVHPKVFCFSTCLKTFGETQQQSLQMSRLSFSAIGPCQWHSPLQCSLTCDCVNCDTVTLRNSHYPNPPPHSKLNIHTSSTEGTTLTGDLF